MKSEFDITTLSIIGIQVINILEKIHDKNIIHTNIKPTIICLGKFIKRNFTEKKLFYLIDFGYSRDLFDTHDNQFEPKIEYENNRVHYKDKKENTFRGTPIFMSINVGKGFRPSRKSDIEELIYTIFYLNKGSLPWSNIRGKNHEEICLKINDVKISTEPEKLFKDFPRELLFIYKNVLKLNFN